MTFVEEKHDGRNVKRDNLGGLYSLDGECFIEMSDKSIVSYAIADGTKVIGANAFRDCANLQKVILPEGIVSLGSTIFSGCTSLKSITLPASVNRIISNPFGTMLHVECKSDSFKVVDNALLSADGTIFLAMTNGESEDYVVPEGVRRLAQEAFGGCSSLRRIELADTLCEVGNHVFWECSSLEEVIIGKNYRFPAYKVDPWTAVLHPERVYANSTGNILMIDRKAGTAVVFNHQIQIKKKSKKSSRPIGKASEKNSAAFAENKLITKV